MPSPHRISLGSARLLALHADNVGTVWVATDRFLARLQGPGLSPAPGTEQLHAGTWLATDVNGHSWFYDVTRGLVQWNGDRPRAFALPFESVRSPIVASDADSTGRLWVAFQNGRIAILGPGGVRVLDGATGLSAGVYHAFYEDSERVMWLGGVGGLSRVSNTGAVTVATRNSFPGEVTSVVEDTTGFLWLGISGGGIVRLAKAEFDKAAAKAEYHLVYTAYTRDDGLAGVPNSTGYGSDPRATRASDGRLWFVTGSGVTIIDPTALSQGRRPYPVRIEEIVVDNVRLPAANSITLPPRTSRLEIDYTTLNLTSSFRSQFRYRLDGVDDKWIEAGTRQEAFYTNLAPRAYRFSVMSSDNENAWNTPPTSIDFAIQPMFYQTTSFLVLSGISTVLALWMLWMIRVRRLRRTFSLVIAERLRLSREIHDTLLQGLVGVALQFEAIANEPAMVSPTAKDQIRGVRRRIEECIREARQAISDLRQSATDGRDLVTALRKDAANATAGNDLKVDLVVTGTPQPCSTEVQEQFVKIGREAVMNSVRHARATRVHMELRYEPTMLRLRISDDGSGFDSSSATDHSAHYGLVGMRERAESVGGSINVVSRPGLGTSLDVCVPNSRRSHASSLVDIVRSIRRLQARMGSSAQPSPWKTPRSGS